MIVTERGGGKDDRTSGDLHGALIVQSILHAGEHEQFAHVCALLWIARASFKLLERLIRELRGRLAQRPCVMAILAALNQAGASSKPVLLLGAPTVGNIASRL